MRYLAAAFALAFSATAFGQAGELWFNYGESILSNSTLTSFSTLGQNTTVKLTDGYRFSFRFGFNQGSHFGHEIQYAFNHTHLQAPGVDEAMHFHQGGYNFLYYLTPDSFKFRPFGTAGVMFDDFIPPGGAINYGSQNKFGANFGGGVKVHVRGMWGVRFDVREYVTGKPDFNSFSTSGALWQTEISGGVGIGF